MTTATQKPRRAAKQDLNEEETSSLCMAMAQDRMVLRRFREEFFDAVKQYVGPHWSLESSTQNIVPVNLIAFYCNVMMEKLVSKEPRVMLSTFERAAKPTVAVMEQWVNEQFERIGLAKTLKRAILNSLFSVGVLKVAISSPEDAAMFGWNMGAGQPYAECVDLDDWVFDTHARDFRQVSYMGHRYRCPLEVAKAMGYKGKAKQELVASMDQPFNLEGDEKTSALLRMPWAANAYEFEDMVELWQIYFPRRKLVITMPDDYLTGPNSGIERKPLRQQEWIGPNRGPYIILGLGGEVPANAMPKGPIQDLIDLHKSNNNIVRKLLRQAERLKDNDLVQMNSEDGERLKNANDGDIIPVLDPKNITHLTSGGPNAALQAFGLQMEQLFSRMAGNLNEISGAGVQAPTATQEKLLSDSASGAVADKQSTTMAWLSEVVDSLCWFYHHHPTNEMKVQHQIQGLPEFNFTRRVTPQQRQQIAWEDLRIKIDPYSLRHQTPEQRAQALTQLVTTVVMPMMQLAQQQGIALDMHALLDKLGKYLDMPDLSEILTIQAPPQPQPGQDQGQGQPGAGGMPQQTTRTYERVSRPQSTQNTNSTSLQQALLGMNPGGTQRNGRPQMNGMQR